MNLISSAHLIDIDLACEAKNVPSKEQLALWAETAMKAKALRPIHAHPELSIRIVDSKEIQDLNHHYRGKNSATNVLSFPAEFPEGVDVPLLGDVIICAPIVKAEAETQLKSIDGHWAHLIIHGTLHLMGYDHLEDDEAHKMETLETSLLASLGYPCPYSETNN